jgi:hypothetical protein
VPVQSDVFLRGRVHVRSSRSLCVCSVIAASCAAGGSGASCRGRSVSFAEAFFFIRFGILTFPLLVIANGNISSWKRRPPLLSIPASEYRSAMMTPLLN